jgi:hypothetical protein
MESYLSGDRVFINPPLVLGDQIARDFETCRRTSPTSTMGVLALSKWAKPNEISRHRKMYHELPPRTHLFTHR